MPRILVVGATGFIGGAFADALVRSGDHTVYGLARSEAKGSGLAAKEITPVVGSITDSAAWATLVRNFEIDVVVNTATFGEDTPKLLDQVAKLGAERLEAYQKGSIKGPKLGYVAVSGLWAHGRSKDRTNDLAPVGKLGKSPPAAMTALLPAYEQSILAKTDVLDVAIIRPAMAFGRAGDIWGALWGPILGAAMQGSADPLPIDIDGDAVISVAHADDIAAGLEAALNKLGQLGGTHPIFDIIGDKVHVRSVLEDVARVFGFNGQLQLKKPAADNVFMSALGTSVNGDSARARVVLGWRARRTDFLGNIAVYANSFKAGQMKGKG